MKPDRKTTIILLLAICTLFSCWLMISSAWDGIKFYAKPSWDFLIFFFNYIFSNAESIIKSNPGKCVLGLLLWMTAGILARIRIAPKETIQDYMIDEIIRSLNIETASPDDGVETTTANENKTISQTQPSPSKGYARTKKKHEHFWRIIKPVVERGGSYDDMRNELKKNLVKTMPTDNTLRKIIREFEK